ncbi:hypothetical protein BD780_000666 [Clostridium tetanomorphum]|uniref:DUF6385 domain-containing protein n=1 Tax=Clostridium tetanomorphum TaxID=1553 RepID=UPI000D8721AA|nr:DUF6385 domain-containing protein [Clostridium tetanomorphum]MBP1863344.1 hypothetical protein [Clostridium tetanomorphum]NRS83441.1 hypothetical protein [Clostridium tetanomorphum]NRZ96641.1 hypothetical protein [Clostridium tetanomorphum]SQC01810.1 Uncharacterised protein [Clostridium tetanomorphum]
MPNKVVFSNIAEDLKVQIYGSTGTGTTPIKVTSDGSVSITGDISITATDLDIRNLTFTQDSVYVYGSDGSTGHILKVDDAGNVIVTATDLDIRNLLATLDTVTVTAEDFDIRNLLATLDTVTVTAEDFDIRNLLATLDTVTVTATDFDIRNLLATLDTVTVTAEDFDIRNLLATLDTVTVTAEDFDIRNLLATLDTVTVTATDFDIRNISYTDDSIELGSRRVTESSNTTLIANVIGTNDPVFTIDTSIYSDASIFVRNTGSADIGFDVEVSPLDDGNYFVDDGAATVTVQTSTSGLLPVGRYGKYTRLIFNTAGSSATAELYFVGVV